MSYIFSRSTMRAYPVALQAAYEASGAWPDDGEPMSDDDYNRLIASRPPEKRLALLDGALMLIDPVATPEQLRAGLTASVQRHLDEAALALGYDDIRSAVSYADEPVVEQFQREGAALRAWRSLVWSSCYGVLDAVMAGQRAIPTEAELLAELPALTIPPAPAAPEE